MPACDAVSAVLEARGDRQTIDVALVRGQAVSMVRSLVSLCGSFYKPSVSEVRHTSHPPPAKETFSFATHHAPPPQGRRVSIHLFYNSSCPPDYQPPLFEDNTNEVHKFFETPPLMATLGEVTTVRGSLCAGVGWTTPARSVFIDHPAAPPRCAHACCLL